MKLERSTWILVGLAFVLGAVVLGVETQRPPTPTAEEDTLAVDPLFEFQESEVQTLTVRRNGETLRFQRAEDDSWEMTQPEQGLAEGGAVAFLLSRLRSDSPRQQTTMTPDQQGDFGFLSPSAQVEFTLADDRRHRLVLGGSAFSGDTLYALVDPDIVPLPEDAGEVPVYVVSQDMTNAVNRPLQEWLMPVDAGVDAPSAPTEAVESEAGESEAGDTETDETPAPEEPQSPAEPAP